MKNELKLTVYKETFDHPLRQATLCFLVKEDKILLAMKKRGFAKGKWNGAGGKSEPGDKTIQDTAVRETFEEIHITPKTLQEVATLNFHFPDNPDWSQQVVVYLATEWEGEPQETDEMAPKWFKFDKIPYDQMWEDDILWLPEVLKGNLIEADFLFDENQKMIEHKIINGLPKML